MRKKQGGKRSLLPPHPTELTISKTKPRCRVRTSEIEVCKLTRHHHLNAALLQERRLCLQETLLS